VSTHFRKAYPDTLGIRKKMLLQDACYQEN
jgi:hypothetical protein